MTNTTSTILVATLVLTSGVCFSEAFSSPLVVKGRSSSSSARFYAPKESHGSPKRRRGRPRKATTTTAANGGKKKRATVAAAAASTVTDPGPVTKRRSRMRRSNNPSSKISAAKPQSSSQQPGSAVMKTLLDHDLLTKEEEQQLGGQIQRAAQLQDTMAVWIEENRSQQQEYQQLESIYGDLYSSDERDVDNPLYGSASSQAMEHHYAQEEEQQDELYYADGTLFLEGEDDDLYGMSDYTVFQPRPQQLQPSVPESWMDEILLLKDDNNLNALSSSTILTDDDIRTVLELPGGRTELRQILLEGSLARERLIRSNIKLVWSIAKKWVGDAPTQYQGDSLVRVYNGAASITGRPTLDEALQEGILGLAEAAERFDPDKGFRFSTYATMWVTNSVRKCFQLESTSGMRLPIPYYDMKRKYVTRVRYYMNTLGEVPAMHVLAEDLGVSVKRLMVALQLTQPLASLDSAIGGTVQGTAGAGKAGGTSANDDGFTLASLLACDQPRPEDHVERSLLRQCLENAMATELSPNERDVVRLRLGLDDGVPRTAKEVANVFGGRFTGPAIRAIEKKAFNKLRSPFSVHTQTLISYLDFAGIDGGNQLLR